MRLLLTLIFICLTQPLLAFPVIEPCQLAPGASTDRFLIIHGLNLRPEKMQDLAAVLGASASTILTLKGHHHYPDFLTATPQQWLQQINRAYCQLKNLNNKVYFLGFSVGAAYGLLFQHFYPMKKPFAKMVLLAPAIVGRGYISLLKLLSWWTTLGIPSRSLAAYRAHKSTPMNAYNNTFRAMDILRTAHLTSSQVPTLVFLETQDELIDFTASKAWIAAGQLDLWRVVPLERKELPLPGQFHHLMIDSKSLGQFHWHWMKSLIVEFLQLSPRN